MQYRRFGKCDFEVSALGFGCMRLPVIDNDEGKINEEEAIRIIRYAIDNGVNYIDTAYPYHKGQSELVVGKALKDGYRERVKLATKYPSWLANSYEDFDKYLNEQLDKLQTSSIDMYLVHSLTKSRWEKLKELGVLRFLDEALKDGRIKYAGFSFHDDKETFKKIVDDYNWTFCQIQYNYMDENYQAGTEGLEYAADKGLAVIIMEPLKGGKLAKTPPAKVQAIWNKSNVKKTPAQWALNWIWNRPEVAVVLSGMGTMEQVVENMQTASEAYPDSLTRDQLDLISEVKEAYKSLIKVDCTGCSYCMPCPAKVDIPENFELYNHGVMYDDIENSKKAYFRFLGEENRASACVKCGKCETVCPQHLSIRKHLEEVHSALGL